jgi:cell division protein FtsB
MEVGRMKDYRTDIINSHRKRRRFSTIWSRTVLITSLLGLLLLLIIYGGRFIHIHRAGRLLAAQQERYIVAVAHNYALQKRLMKRNSHQYIEYLARKRLGLVMPGEIKVIFVRRE